MKQGASGAEVVKLQKRLNELGFKVGAADGKFGSATTAAVKKFQKQAGLKADGVVGPKTLKALKLDRATENETKHPISANNALLLTEADFEAAAKILNCDVAAIKAVAEVESNGNGFLSDGRLKVLFEGHQFYKYSKGKHATSHPTLCFKNWTKKYYTKGDNPDVCGAGELARLEQAMKLDRHAALMSASYGKFQIMGFNYEVCGFDNVEDFFQAMKLNEGEQLKAFSLYVIGNGIDVALRKHDWVTFAKRYNGEEYWKNKYDTKLATAHAKYSK